MSTQFSDDGIPFEFVSDEYNGINRGPGETSPGTKVVARSNSFKQAEELSARSRIYRGHPMAVRRRPRVLWGNKVAADVSPR